MPVVRFKVTGAHEVRVHPQGDGEFLVDAWPLEDAGTPVFEGNETFDLQEMLEAIEESGPPYTPFKPEHTCPECKKELTWDADQIRCTSCNYRQKFWSRIVADQKKAGILPEDYESPPGTW